MGFLLNSLFFCSYHVLYLLLDKVPKKPCPTPAKNTWDRPQSWAYAYFGYLDGKIHSSLVNVSPPTWILYPAIVCYTFNKAGLAILTGTFCKFWDMHAPLWYLSQRMLKPCLRWGTAMLRQWKLSTPIIRLDSRGKFEFGGAAECLKPCPHLSAELWLAVYCIKREVSTACPTPFMCPGQFLGKVSRCFWQEKKYSWRAQTKRRNCWELPCLNFFMVFSITQALPTVTICMMLCLLTSIACWFRAPKASTAILLQGPCAYSF